MMRVKVQKNKARGVANYGWLKAKYSFSFANYYNPEHINFDALRVLNDDIIAAGAGFGKHPHDNMEIISIPLQGALQHKDSMGEKWIPLHTGEVQVMSAGTGITHAEKNYSSNEELNLFQIWIMPDQRDHTPIYGQKKFDAAQRKNKLQTLVSSYTETVEESLKIHQDARISRINLSKNEDFTYYLKSEYYRLYFMLISGDLTIANNHLQKRDAVAISQIERVSMHAKTDAEILFIEIPMKF